MGQVMLADDLLTNHEQEYKDCRGKQHPAPRGNLALKETVPNFV